MNIGSKITISEFAYTNKFGGTGVSKPFSSKFYIENEEYFEEPITVMVTKTWEDYETGVRGWALPDQSNIKLMAFLKRKCKEGWNKIYEDKNGMPNFEWVDEPGTFILYWGEHDIVE